MTHLPPLIYDLALILVAGALATLLFRKLKQPVVLGYILAGFLVSPHFPWTPSVGDEPGLHIWAEIGVIFLLFSLGLEFSFKRLVAVGGAATITAVIEVIGMTTIGFLTAKLLGWNEMDSLFLGGILAISSTTIIIRALDETGQRSNGFVSLVFGALIVEDLVAILLLVLLSTLAVTRSFNGLEILISSARLGFFLVLWFLGGIFVLPTFLRRVRVHLSDETLLIVAIGLCFLMVVIAAESGFSPALGAFVMGSLLAETSEAKRIEHLIVAVKDLFGAIFFVSVGMMINPEILWEYAGPIALITVVTLIGKIFFSSGGALLAGRPLKESVQAGMSFAQIGEFSFIIASTGLSLKVTGEHLYPIAVGVSALTTFATPYLIRDSDRAVRWLEKNLPSRLQESIERYSRLSQATTDPSVIRQVLKSYFSLILLNTVLITAIFIGFTNLLPPFLISIEFPDAWITTCTLGCATVASLPFLWALVRRTPAPQLTHKLWSLPEWRASLIGLNAIRLGLAILLYTTLSARLVERRVALILVSVLTVLFLVGLFSRVASIYSWFERRFFENLSENDTSHDETF